jgi:phenylalanyl-tRNA synthetase beta chain
LIKSVLSRATDARTLGRRPGAIPLFDVYRGPSIEEGARSLAFRLRFCALDHTLTDQEVGVLRADGIAAVERAHGARLR